VPRWIITDAEGAPLGPRPVTVAGIGLLCAAGIGAAGAGDGRPGSVPGFRARKMIAERKSIKLMSRAVQLGVAAAGVAVAGTPDWEAVPPLRRGMYVGASPQTTDAGALQPALRASLAADGRFDMGAFARDGISLIHPLWLVRGLSNNILGFTSASANIQGVNANYCDGPMGGLTALQEAARAVAWGRADAVLAGGADALVGADELFGTPDVGEGAAFVVFRPAESEDGPRVPLDPGDWPIADLGLLGAATWPVALARWLYRLGPAN